MVNNTLYLFFYLCYVIHNLNHYPITSMSLLCGDLVSNCVKNVLYLRVYNLNILYNLTLFLLFSAEIFHQCSVKGHAL